MSSALPWLAIDCGAAFTKAVLVWPGGGSVVLRFDGADAVSSAAHVRDGTVLVGAAAWRQAETLPDGFVPEPLRAGMGKVELAGVDREVADLVAAVLRQVAAEATRVSGEPVLDHVVDDTTGIALSGEIDIFGKAWTPKTWTVAAKAGTAWSGGTWNGTEWTGAGFTGTSWTSKTWLITPWTALNWAGRSWADSVWAGRSWAAGAWTGRSWAAEMWSGRSWAGRVWG